MWACDYSEIVSNLYVLHLHFEGIAKGEDGEENGKRQREAPWELIIH